MPVSKFGKRIEIAEGFLKGQNSDTGVVIEGDTVNVNPAMQVALGGVVSGLWRTIYTWNIPEIGAMALASINAFVTQDVSMSGAARGDIVLASTTTSISTLVQWAAACLSNDNIQLRAWYNGSIVLTPGNVPFKILCIKVT